MSFTTYASNPSASSGHPTGAERVQAQMHVSPYSSLRRIVCESRDGELVLRGHVESYHLKQVAQETARQQSPGRTIINLLTVD